MDMNDVTNSYNLMTQPTKNLVSIRGDGTLQVHSDVASPRNCTSARGASDLASEALCSTCIHIQEVLTRNLEADTVVLSMMSLAYYALLHEKM
jgi:hypothetical protein